MTERIGLEIREEKEGSLYFYETEYKNTEPKRIILLYCN